MGRFMQYYREHGKYLERTYDFVPRVGIERLRKILVEDSQGICARLDARSRSRSTPTTTRGPEADRPVTQTVSSPRQIALPVLN